jgi:hypothetical protein
MYSKLLPICAVCSYTIINYGNVVHYFELFVVCVHETPQICSEMSGERVAWWQLLQHLVR